MEVADMCLLRKDLHVIGTQQYSQLRGPIHETIPHNYSLTTEERVKQTIGMAEPLS